MKAKLLFSGVKISIFELNKKVWKPVTPKRCSGLPRQVEGFKGTWYKICLIKNNNVMKKIVLTLSLLISSLSFVNANDNTQINDEDIVYCVTERLSCRTVTGCSYEPITDEMINEWRASMEQFYCEQL